MNLSALYAQLHAEGLVARPEAPAPSTPNPWYVRVMLGFCGFVAALFVLGFIGMFFTTLVEKPAGLFVAGAVLCALALVLYRVRADGDMAAQFALALSLAGQIAVGVAIFWGFDNLPDRQTVPALLFAAFECALLMLVPNFLHRFVCAVAAMAACYWALQHTEFAYLLRFALGMLSVALWLGQAQFARYAALLRPLAYAAALTLLGLNVYTHWSMSALWSTAHHTTYDAPAWRLLLASAALALPLLWLAWRLTHNAGPRVRGAALAACLLVVALTWRMPYLASALLVSLLGFAASNRILLGLGLLGLLHALSWYYYTLDLTLLQKSIALAATGASLLAARWLALPRFQAEDHA